MKQRSFHLPIWFLLILAIPAQAQVLNWDYEDITSDIRESGANPDYYFTPDGNVHISYWDKNQDVLVYGMREKATGGWSFQTVLPTIGSHGYRSAIGVDDAGAVHIAFHDRNVADEAELRYVTNQSGSWIMSAPTGNRSLGPYGYDFSNPRFSQGSLDVEFLPDGRPFIAFYDGSAQNLLGCQIATLPVYSQYDLDLSIAEKTPTGEWVVHAMPDLADENSVSCLPHGERFGEFCQIIPRGNGSFFILTNSMHNHELILFASDSANVATWTYQALDSTERVLPGTPGFFETFDHPSAVFLEDSVLLISSSVSWLYGSENSVSNRTPFTFYRWTTDSAGAKTLTLEDYQRITPNNSYRTYASLAATSSDTFYIPYVRTRRNQLELLYSFDGGNTILNDTIGFLSTNTRLQSHLMQDSLYIWAYSQLDDILVEYRLPRSLGSVDRRIVTKTETKGRILASEVLRQSGDDEVYVMYSEDFSNDIRLSSRVGGTWTTTSLAQLPDLQSLALLSHPDETLEALYSGGDPEAVYSATPAGSTWTHTLVAPFGLHGLYGYSGTDSVYAAGRRISDGHLIWLSKPQNGGAWTWSVLDTAFAPTGQSPVIRQLADTVYLAYHSSGGNLVRLATRVNGQPWQRENVTQPLNFIPANLDMDVDSKGSPVIAFKDGNTDRIILAERGETSWETNPVPTAPGNLIGSPLRLILDSKDRPWILYNFPEILDEVRLLRRDASGNWIGVSVLNNQGQIANTFDFHLVEDDFYIIGRKNETGDEGVALLYAENGVRTLIPEGDVNLPLTLVPNPARDQVSVEFSVSATGMGQLALYNLQGQMIHSQSVSLRPGTQSIQVPLAGLVPGSYFLAVHAGQHNGRSILIVAP